MAITLKRSLRCVLLAVTCFLSASAALGEKRPEPYALIFGTVYDANSRPVPGVKVKIARMKGNKTGKTWEHISDRRGEFAQRVPAGEAEYLIWADLKHEKNQPKSTRPEVTVRIQNDERQDISLHLIP
ncbi:MAG: carboxypeptidase-like regulatory domain-containing protein [Acidobacteriales bacterium]|nr:carboxypeptidase-like regulatory domain-containing protein [Terriglobales bacterium]